MRESLILAGVVLAATAAGALTWRHYAPRSFWLIAVFPFKAAHLYLTWAHVASGCGLTPGLQWVTRSPPAARRLRVRSDPQVPPYPMDARSRAGRR
jgi:hypothetical protein